MDDHDTTKAEFFRSFRSIDFNGRALLQRLEVEQKLLPVFEFQKPLPVSADTEQSTEVWLRHFPELYGYRGKNVCNRGVFLLSPWEFLTYWECVTLPAPSQPCKSDDLSVYYLEGDAQTVVPNERMESETVLFFPIIPGDIQLRDKWYMRRRKRPMIPAPVHSPMPDRQKDANAKAKVFSVYMRPWTLDRNLATVEVSVIESVTEYWTSR